MILCNNKPNGPTTAQSESTQRIIEERIEIIVQNDTIIGYLNKPNNIASFPVVIVLHSASHGHHDNAIYNHLEENLTSIGIGVFTYDRRGSGESSGDFNAASLEDLANDAINAIKELKTRNDIISDKIGLFGISQGGWIAPLAYNLMPDDISFMILVSSSGVSPARQMEYSAVTTLQMNNYSPEIITKAKHLRNITNEYYRGNRDRVITQEEIDQFRDEDWFNDVYLPWQGNLPEDVGVTKWIHEMDFDPKKYFETIKVPTVLFYGSTDRWVPIEESVKIWEVCFDRANNKDYEIHRIQNSGHMMILNEDDNPEQELISDEYTRKLKVWATENIK
ncbi:MAG: hypothetical protein DHS20C17_22980 [Cyclobacteriaceae bacterium]|nr:MAG: hypothetical protein DHS20C17_22980 [Cyclobacteriaceae bacterium]